MWCLLFKTKPAVAPKETITHHFFVSGIGQKKTAWCSQIYGAENVVKIETQQTFVNGLLGFITLVFILRLEARVLLTIIAWVAHRYGQLYLHCSLIYFWFLPVVLHSDQPSSSEGEIIPFSGVCQSGSCIIHAEAVVACRTDWQTALMCNRRPAQHHHAEHHFQL